MATDIIARGMITEYKSGTNIDFKENEDGSVTISASGDVSSEDTVARETIDNHKLDKNNPHNVTAEQVGLGNVDNTSDLDKPISTAIQTALDDKADKTTATKDSDGLMSAADKAKLDGIEENANRTVVDSELSETSENPVQNKAVAKAVKGGNSISGSSSYTITDSVEYPIVGLKVFGKSTQDGTPTPENPVEIVSVGDNGSVAVQSCGKNLFDYTLLADTAYNGVTFKNNNDGTFTISGEKNDISKSFISSVNLSHEESIGLFPSGNYTISGFPKNWGLHASIGLFYNGKMHNSVANTVNNPTLTITKDILTDDFNVSISVYSASNNQITVGTFYLQIEKGSIATDFEPYHGETANITTSMPLCGIPVDSDGNYTDSKGQQWVCDTLVYNADGSGKIVKRTDKIDSYNGESITTPSISTTGSMTTGATVIYQLAEPQEIELTATEMTALRELQTFNGITNISNDGGTDMGVTYCTNKMLSEYVMPITTGLQKQIDELKAAVLSLGGNV